MGRASQRFGESTTSSALSQPWDADSHSYWTHLCLIIQERRHSRECRATYALTAWEKKVKTPAGHKTDHHITQESLHKAGNTQVLFASLCPRGTKL